MREDEPDVELELVASSRSAALTAPLRSVSTISSTPSSSISLTNSALKFVFFAFFRPRAFVAASFFFDFFFVVEVDEVFRFGPERLGSSSSDEESDEAFSVFFCFWLAGALFFFFVPVSRCTDTAPAASCARSAASASKNLAFASSSSSESSI